MARITMAALVARLEALEAENATLKAAAQPSEASQHYAARDIACPLNGKALKTGGKCSKTFRTEKGRDWHVANSH